MKKFADTGGGIEIVRRECMDRERWRLFYVVIPLGAILKGNEASDNID